MGSAVDVVEVDARVVVVGFVVDVEVDARFVVVVVMGSAVDVVVEA